MDEDRVTDTGARTSEEWWLSKNKRTWVVPVRNDSRARTIWVLPVRNGGRARTA